MRNSFSPRIQLDNEGESGLGGGSDLGASAGGGEGAAPVNDFVPRKDFEGVSQKLSGYERELAELKQWRQQQSQSSQSQAAPAEPKKPNVKDYDFSNDPTAIDRYNDDLFDYKFHAREKSNAEKQKPQLEAQKRQESLNRANTNFNTLANDYEKENPGFRAKVATQGLPRTYDEVLPLILRSKESPAIVDHFYEHPEALAELNSVASQEGVEAAAEYLGELRATLKNQKTVLNGNLGAASLRPPRANLKGSVGGNSALTPEQIMKF